MDKEQLKDFVFKAAERQFVKGTTKIVDVVDLPKRGIDPANIVYTTVKLTNDGLDGIRNYTFRRLNK